MTIQNCKTMEKQLSGFKTVQILSVNSTYTLFSVCLSICGTAIQTKVLFFNEKFLIQTFANNKIFKSLL